MFVTEQLNLNKDVILSVQTRRGVIEATRMPDGNGADGIIIQLKEDGCVRDLVVVDVPHDGDARVFVYPSQDNDETDGIAF